MIPVMQSIVGDGKDGRPNGDCFRACVASIFELPLEQVPHFLAPTPVGWWDRFQAWLRPFGLVADQRDHRRKGPRPEWWPGGWWIASVESEHFPGTLHAVVMHGLAALPEGDDWMTRVAHDPSPTPRRSPYLFHEALWFTALDPAAIVRAAGGVR